MSDIFMNFYEDLLNKQTEAKEKIILDQLNEFISRGLLVIREGEKRLIKDKATNKFYITQKFDLQLRDQEYIERLEDENKALRKTLDLASDLLKFKS